MKKNCQKCREEFEEEDLDLYNGKWLCSNCEFEKEPEGDVDGDYNREIRGINEMEKIK
jgi:Zn finger protein HypA/HybF involved in hydrogenase expression